MDAEAQAVETLYLSARVIASPNQAAAMDKRGAPGFRQGRAVFTLPRSVGTVMRLKPLRP
jgi:hypothetical protein